MESLKTEWVGVFFAGGINVQTINVYSEEIKSVFCVKNFEAEG